MHPYSSIDVTAAWKKLRFILSVRSDFHIVDSLLIAVHAFVNLVSMSFSVDSTTNHIYLSIYLSILICFHLSISPHYSVFLSLSLYRKKIWKLFVSSFFTPSLSLSLSLSISLSLSFLRFFFFSSSFLCPLSFPLLLKLWFKMISDANFVIRFWNLIFWSQWSMKSPIRNWDI